MRTTDFRIQGNPLDDPQDEDMSAAPGASFQVDCTISVPIRITVGPCALHVTGGQAAEDRMVPLPSGRMVVGSGLQADLRLMDNAVSARHCEIRNQGGRVTVQDLGSKNGTWLQGARISSGELQVGQILRLGRVSLMLLEGGASAKGEPGEVLPGVIGASSKMRRLARQVRLLAQSDLTVLVVGQTGTGKELVARALHGLSHRRQATFVPQNCGALPEHLVESELFGHERGAFTGAQETRPGLFETAQGGTLFLDEIGELPLAQQPKLLRVLESRQVRRLGGRDLIPVNVRVVAATHAALPERILSGRFRRDLFYRLGEATVEVPPLEARREDIPLLVKRFVAELGGSCSMGVHGWETVPVEILEKRSYPGNVRELRNLVRRAAVLGWEQALRGCEGTALDPMVPMAAGWEGGSGGGRGSLDQGFCHIPIVSGGGGISLAAEEASTYPIHLSQIQDQLLLRAYRAAAGNRAQAARSLGMAKSTFNDRLRRLLSE